MLNFKLSGSIWFGNKRPYQADHLVATICGKEITHMDLKYGEYGAIIRWKAVAADGSPVADTFPDALITTVSPEGAVTFFGSENGRKLDLINLNETGSPVLVKFTGQLDTDATEGTRFIGGGIEINVLPKPAALADRLVATFTNGTV